MYIYISEYPPYADWSPGDVIAAWRDGSIMLDDSIVTWNPFRAKQFVAHGGKYEDE